MANTPTTTNRIILSTAPASASSNVTFTAGAAPTHYIDILHKALTTENKDKTRSLSYDKFDEDSEINQFAIDMMNSGYQVSPEDLKALKEYAKMNIDKEKGNWGTNAGKYRKKYDQYNRLRGRIDNLINNIYGSAKKFTIGGGEVEYGAEGYNDPNTTFYSNKAEAYKALQEQQAAQKEQEHQMADAAKWAGKNYMDTMLANTNGLKDQQLATDHEGLINQLVTYAGPIEDALVQNAKAGNTWGKNSQDIYNKAISNLINTGDFEKAVQLRNSMQARMANAKNWAKDWSAEKFATANNADNLFNNQVISTYLNSDAGRKAVNEYYDKTGAGFLDDYTKFQEEEKKKPALPNFAAAYNKNGGTMRKYQQGGQPTVAQIVLDAIQSLQNGDSSKIEALFSDKKTLSNVVGQLQTEVKNGNKEAAQALQMLQEVFEQLDPAQAPGATPSHKNGAKIAYIHRLATGCPEGTELKYFKKGGHICKACVEKAKKAKCGTKAQEGAELEKCGGKAKKKKYFQPGGAVSKKRTTPAPGTKQEADSAATADRLNKGKEVYSEKTGEWIRTSPNGRTIQKTDEDGAGTITIYTDKKGRKKQYVKPYANGGLLLSQLQQTYRNLNKQI